MPVAPTRAAAPAALALGLALLACSGGGGDSPPPPPPPCTPTAEACAAPGECCSGSCLGGMCACSALGAACGSSAECCPGTSARRCDGGACVAGCRAVGDVCDWASDCCSLNCDDGGHCAPPCLPQGTGCTSSAQCCAYLGCATGACTYACKTSGACTSSNECCSGDSCRAGLCQDGLCGTWGQTCTSEADCCTAASGGKEYVCNIPPGSVSGSCDLGQPGEACGTDADCYGAFPCRDGYCHWTDGSQADGFSCLDGQECRSGVCTSTAAGTQGFCCSGSGASCSTSGGGTLCCEPLECSGVTGSQTCRGCLDPTNSGPQGGAGGQCSSVEQCCEGMSLTCEAGECCTRRASPCSTDAQCCAGARCGDVTDSTGTTATDVCCGDYGASCGWGTPCCDGHVCSASVCRVEPGGACTEDVQCGAQGACRLDTPPTGVCCLHPDAACDADSDCCTGSCNPSTLRCDYGRSYDPCVADTDCLWRYFGTWPAPVCGGNANLPQACCPIPGDRCVSAADCCEAGDSCKAPLTGDDLVTTRCCRETQASCSDDPQCCTGMCWSHYVGGAPTGTCCALPYMSTFTCASDADCCDSQFYNPVYGSTQCGDGTTMRCCFKAGQRAYQAADCCSGRLDQTGWYCR